MFDRVDPQFRALPLAALADAALTPARERGAQHADIRVERIVTQTISLRDGAVTGVVDETGGGLAVRVLGGGGGGGAASRPRGAGGPAPGAGGGGWAAGPSAGWSTASGASPPAATSPPGRPRPPP